MERDFPAVLPELVADPDQLRAVLTNLILNALEAMTGPSVAGSRLRLSLGLEDAPGGEAGQDLVVSVEDDGPGVPPELRERIFHPFFTTRESGSGVGLALAQKLVAGHGGALELADGEGGAVFRVRLPLEATPT